MTGMILSTTHMEFEFAMHHRCLHAALLFVATLSDPSQRVLETKADSTRRTFFTATSMLDGSGRLSCAASLSSDSECWASQGRCIPWVWCQVY